jgi:predicted phage replisome organizer
VADVKWIKITTDIFDDEKILLIESLPDAYAIITVWFKLLCLAGKQNNNGVFMMGRIAYTDKMLATIFRMKESTVTMALQTFEQFGMVEIVGGVITIPNWGKHQSLDAYEKKKLRDRERIARKRAEQKALIAMSPDTSPDKSPDVASLDRDKEEDKDKEIDIDNKSKEKTDFQSVVDLYHSICKSFPSVRSLSDARKKAIKARLKSFTMDDFRSVFEKAEASSFLKGSDGGWKASFDWLIKESNMLKVLEGNYADKPRRCGRKEPVPGWMPFEAGEAELEAIQRVLREDPVTAGSSPELAERAEQLRQQLQGG